MKRIVLGLMLSVVVNYAWAEEAKKLSCKQTKGNNTQCTYEVIGQKINDPEEESELYAMSNMPYALCSSAVCIVDEDKPGLAKCICHVYGYQNKHSKWQAASVGPYTYAQSKPAKRKHELYSVTSNFSFANLADKSQMQSRTCRFKEPTEWANCFGARCRVKQIKDGHYIADCRCPVVKTNTFISMGPKNQKQCRLPKKHIWSAATEQQGKNDFAVIMDTYKHFYPGSPMSK